MTEQTEKEVLGEILSGKYRDYYLPYNRKSTDDAESQKNSINYQKRKNLEFFVIPNTRAVTSGWR